CPQRRTSQLTNFRAARKSEAVATAPRVPRGVEIHLQRPQGSSLATCAARCMTNFSARPFIASVLSRQAKRTRGRIHDPGASLLRSGNPVFFRRRKRKTQQIRWALQQSSAHPYAKSRALKYSETSRLARR